MTARRLLCAVLGHRGGAFRYGPVPRETAQWPGPRVWFIAACGRCGAPTSALVGRQEAPSGENVASAGLAVGSDPVVVRGPVADLGEWGPARDAGSIGTSP